MLNRMTPELQHQLLLVATNAALDAIADDDKPFQCFKCDKDCDDWKGSECETCGEFFCDDCLVEADQAMAPECCHTCADEAAGMQDTYDTMPKGRD